MMLMYACFKIGAILSPLDLRLKDDEVVRDLNKIEPKAFSSWARRRCETFGRQGEPSRKGAPPLNTWCSSRLIPNLVTSWRGPSASQR